MNVLVSQCTATWHNKSVCTNLTTASTSNAGYTPVKTGRMHNPNNWLLLHVVEACNMQSLISALQNVPYQKKQQHSTGQLSQPQVPPDSPTRACTCHHKQAAGRVFCTSATSNTKQAIRPPLSQCAQCLHEPQTHSHGAHRRAVAGSTTPGSAPSS